MELLDYIRVFRKWLWLIVLIAVISGVGGYLVRQSQAPVYEAQVMLTVGGYIEAPNPSSGEIRTGVELAQTYAVLVKTYDVLQAAVDAGDFPLTPDQVRRMISTTVVPNTSLLVITIAYTDPILAADVANEVAQQLILNSPTNLTSQQQDQLELVNSEISWLNAQLTDARAELQRINAQLADAENSPYVAEQLTAQRNELISQINQTSANLAQFSNSITALQERTNSLDIVEQARIPTSPSGPSPLLTGGFVAALGGLLAFLAVLLVEYLDDTLKTPEDASQLLALRVVGAIPRFGGLLDGYDKRLVTLEHPGSPVAEGYRALRANLLFATGNEGKRPYILTSPGPQEGKSVTAANLAVAMAATNLRVLLIDADLRRPRQHEIFGLKNEIGLATLLSADPEALQGLDNPQLLNDYFKQCIQETEVPGLSVVTSGFVPPNPAELLGSALMQTWMDVLRTSDEYDVVLFDTPPALVVSDSFVLAGTVGASVVLVLRAGKTRRSSALRAKEQFMQLAAVIDNPIKGVIFNLIKSSDLVRYGGYNFRYSTEAETIPHRNGKYSLQWPEAEKEKGKDKQQTPA